MSNRMSDPGWKSGDDYLHKDCAKCGNPATNEIEVYEGLSGKPKSAWLCDKCFAEYGKEDEELSPCCGSPKDSRFNSDICSKCGEHF